MLFLVLLSLAVATLAAARPKGTVAPDTPGTVTLPLSRWQALQEALRSGGKPAHDGSVLWIARRLEGRFQQGLYSGRLSARFEVSADAPTRVPVLDAQAIVGETRLDGEPAALLAEGDMYGLMIEAPGRHELTVDFQWGRESQRFTRTVRLSLPEGGPLSLETRIAERDIEASLAGGALTSAEPQGEDTVIRGHLDGAGALDLSWKRRVKEEVNREARLSARQHALFEVSEALVIGRSAITFQVLAGETDTVSLDVPRGLEVVRVSGDAVLQWRTSLAPDESSKLTVLLRHFITDTAEIRVDFQFPCEPGTKLSLAMPMPDVPTTGDLGVLGPPGLSLEAQEHEGAEPLAPRELSTELRALTESPVRLGFRFERAPRVALMVTRLLELSLARTQVDELSASTVLLEDGTERSKLSLRIRNSTRQYVEMTLPEGARLSDAFLDGRKVRPATRGGALLFPLRQSERLAENQPRIHVVRPGETLSDVANLYYSDPAAWVRIVNLNRGVVDATGALTRGARLTIPPASEGAEKEAFFVLEVAYERSLPAFGAVGRRALRLPSLDVDTTKAVWHVYFPHTYEPLAFRGNVTQMSGIKYDPFRRLKWYLEDALASPRAWAGEGYANILTKRRSIYDEEARSDAGDGAALSTFPLVGERYKFRRILLGREAPELSVTFASMTLVAVARHATLVVAFGLTLWALRRGGRARWLAVFTALVVLVFLSHHMPGLHRRIVWGADLALLAALLRALGPRLRRRARVFSRAPWLLARAVSLRGVLATAGFAWLAGRLASYPMLLPLAALPVLAVACFRVARSAQNPRSIHAH